MEESAKQNIKTKILTRVGIPGLDNIKNILAINDRIGKEMIEIRHCYQPLRTTIIDNKVVVFKESRKPEVYAKGELKEEINILYYIYDEEWIEWMQKVFWNLFRSSIPAQKRILDIETMKKIN